MAKRKKICSQPSLQFECGSCLYMLTDRCKGATDFSIYAKQGLGIVPCVDTLKRQELLDDLYSQMPPRAKKSYQDRIVLPPFIPQIKDGIRGVPDFSFPSLFAISLGYFLTVKNLSITKVRERLKLPSSAQLVLIGTADDYVIERMWAESERINIWRKIAEFGFAFVTTTTFSVYDEDTRATQVFSQDRNFMTYDRLANLGVPTIPFLFPYNEEDYEAAFRWLRERPDINKIAVLAQFQKTDKQFAQFLESIRIIKCGVARPLEFLVVGVARQDRIQKIFREFNASIVSGKPFHEGRAGYLTNDDLSHPDNSYRWKFTPAKLVGNNTRKFFLKCEELKSQIGSEASQVLAKTSRLSFPINQRALEFYSQP